ncbi:MAG TPA: permease prefix domain 1-containing protein [Chthonomonadaceae bacterium]|nr:permease prefix domain 1-containing protein [Chthonomonadaceae bacterium]
MLQHTTGTGSDVKATTGRLPGVAPAIVEPIPADNEQIEDLLDSICARLVGRTPYARRTELRAEMRQHLHSLALAYQELGESPERAVALAIAKFGSPEQVASEWSFPQGTRAPRTDIRDWIRSRWRGMGAVASLCMVAAWLGFALHAGTALTVVAGPSSGPAGAVQQRADRGAWVSSGRQMPPSHHSVQFANCMSCHSAAAPIGNIRNEYRADLPPARLWSKP